MRPLGVPRIATCGGCGADAPVDLVATDKNRVVSEQRFHYARCSECDTWTLADPPPDLSRYYGDDYHEFPDPTDLARVAKREGYQIGHVLEAVDPGGSLVEVGGAWGVFASQAASAGFDVHVIEMSGPCCDYLRSVVGVGATCSDDPERELARMPAPKVVALWQVFEHLPDPLAFLDVVADVLQDDGILVLATPNPSSLGARLTGPNWPHLDAPRHLRLFPPAALAAAAEARGLEEVYLVDDDIGARRWNRFAWQRLLLNRFRSAWLRGPLLVAGAALSILISPWETKSGNGSSYTAVFRKVRA